MEPRTITVKGAREHNLRDVSLSLPRGKLICLTGVSGSGKSSFAFDTLFAEGQRRYLESLSSYARQFLGQLTKPDVDQITGLSPAISIQQKASGWNPRSTVGTVTQIHDYLRVLYARVGRQHCPDCGLAISAQTREQIISRILELPATTNVLILAPVARGQKGEYRDLFEDMIKQGYARARVDGGVVALSDLPTLKRHIRHNIEIVVDRLTISPTIRPRLAEAVEGALKLGDGALIVHIVSSDRAAGSSPRGLTNKRDVAIPDLPPGAADTDDQLTASDAPRKREDHRKPDSGLSLSSPLTKGGKRGVHRDASMDPAPQHSARREGREVRRSSGGQTGDLLLSAHYACPKCDVSFESPSPQLFSFNSPTGMCLTCDGLGTVFDFDPDLLVPNPRKSFLKLAVEPMRTRIGKWRRHIYRGVATHVGFDLGTPWGRLPQEAKDALLYGLGDTHITFEWRWSGGVWRHGGTFPGVIAELREKHRGTKSSFIRRWYEKYMRKTVCPDCNGGRLNAQATAVRVGGLNINEACARSIRDVGEFFATLKLTPTEQIIATEVLKEIRGRLRFLCDVGLEYLTL
ncbi:MAG: excinuclease ABC subunit A, partial [Planctomycetes bacterium]|nr:excinuclease ABC subunit A [Planctomycetota bacterium]